MGVNKPDVPDVIMSKQESIGGTQLFYSKFQISQSQSFTTLMLPVI